MEHKANILVTEVFDTELIGEGAISTFNHAHENLLTQDCHVVPTSGTIYAQIVSSELCSRWNQLHDIDQIVIPEEIRGSGASSLALHDLQLNQMTQMKGHFEPLSEPIAIFNFDFSKSNREPIPYNRQSANEFNLLRKDKNADAIFMWWDLRMDPNETIVLSCAPYWCHPEKSLFDKGIKEMVSFYL